MDNKKELLGEYYVDYQLTKDKNLLIDIINRFINKNPNFKPITNDRTSEIYNFTITHGLKFIDKYFFSRNVPYQIHGGYNTFAICLDENNVKHVILKRGIYNAPKQMNNRLSLETIRNLYKCLVYDVIDQTKIYRELKEVKTLINNFKSNTPLIVKNKVNSYSHCYQIIKDIRYEETTKYIKIVSLKITIRDNDGSIVYDKQFLNSAHNNIQSVTQLLHCDNIITKEMLYEDIIKATKVRISKIEEDTNNILELINNKININ